MRRKIWAAVGAGALLVGSILPALAATEAGVTATVTVQNISVSVADGNVAYGTLAVNTSKDTTNTGVNDTQTATNDGNVNETFNIKGSDSVAWTLAAAPSTNQYKHEFCTTGTGVTDPCDATPTYTALTTPGYLQLATPIAPSGTKKFDLKITTPTSSSSFAEQNVNVTVQATAI